MWWSSGRLREAGDGGRRLAGLELLHQGQVRLLQACASYLEVGDGAIVGAEEFPDEGGRVGTGMDVALPGLRPPHLGGGFGRSGERVGRPVGDDPTTVLETLEGLLEGADIVVTTGGVSMGAHDVVKAVLSRQGVEFTQVAMQPGKPQGFGTIGPDKTPVLTLPGNPVSAFVSFQILVRPALRVLQGLPAGPLPSVWARLTASVTSPPGRRSYLRGVLGGPAHDRGAERTVRPVTRQDSHQLSALADADSLVVVPENVTELPAGTIVETLLLP